MGWSNSDLHRLTADHQQFGIPDTEYGDSLTRTGKTDRFFWKHENQWITYEYDFGDSWEHKILLEKILLVSTRSGWPQMH